LAIILEILVLLIGGGEEQAAYRKIRLLQENHTISTI
jgi:hypothetical protein